MNDTAIERTNGITAATLEQVLIGGDLAKLSPAQRVEYYAKTCQSLGLNPLTKPFDYITLNGKMVLYAKRDATDQLRQVHKVSIVKLEREQFGDVYVVTAYARTEDREDSSIGAVNIKGLQGESLANALMKAETKAKRRVTLSICGLGMLDETEIGSIPTAGNVTVSSEGEIISAPEIIPPKELTRPYSPETLRTGIRKHAELNGGKTASEKQRGLVGGVLSEIYQDEILRHDVQGYLTGYASLKDMPDEFILALLDWLKPEKDSGGAYHASAMAANEAALIPAAAAEQGQQPLPLD